MFAPDEIASEAQVCRRSCKSNPVDPADRRHRLGDDLDAVATALDAAAEATADPLRTGPVLRPVDGGRNSL
jgi:hypothetical protein